MERLRKHQFQQSLYIPYVTNSHAQLLLCNVLFVQLELDLNLIFRFLCYDQIACVHFITRVIERVPDTFSIDQ